MMVAETARTYGFEEEDEERGSIKESRQTEEAQRDSKSHTRTRSQQYVGELGRSFLTTVNIYLNANINNF
jgi:hypothetical protein